MPLDNTNRFCKELLLLYKDRLYDHVYAVINGNLSYFAVFDVVSLRSELLGFCLAVG